MRAKIETALFFIILVTVLGSMVMMVRDLNADDTFDLMDYCPNFITAESAQYNCTIAAAIKHSNRIPSDLINYVRKCNGPICRYQPLPTSGVIVYETPYGAHTVIYNRR